MNRGSRYGCVVMACTSALFMGSAVAWAGYGYDAPKAESYREQSQLQSIRSSLIDQAIAQGTRVRSSAWIDQHGVLHENTRFRSDLTLRGIRIPAFLPAESDFETGGQPALEPLGVGHADAKSGQSESVSGAIAEEPCGPSLDLKAVASLSVGLRADATLPGYAELLALAETVRALVIMRLGSRPHWQVRLKPNRPQGPYWDRVEGGIDESAPLRLMLEVAPGRLPDAGPARPAMAFAMRSAQAGWLRVQDRWQVPEQRRGSAALRLALYEGFDSKPLWVGEDSFVWREGGRGLRSAGFASDTLDPIIAAWMREIDATLACRIPRFAVIDTASQGSLIEFVIAAGDETGLRRGDRLIIVDARGFPASLLDQGVTESMLLVEVIDVQSGRSRLRNAVGDERHRAMAGDRPGTLVALPL